MLYVSMNKRNIERDRKCVREREMDFKLSGDPVKAKNFVFDRRFTQLFSWYDMRMLLSQFTIIRT